MSKALRFSRWRRLPGVHRILDQRLPTHAEEPQRITLYVPGGVLDQADRLARLEGAEHRQAYCERLLTRAIQAEAARLRVDGSVSIDVREEELEALARDRPDAHAQGDDSLRRHLRFESLPLTIPTSQTGPERSTDSPRLDATTVVLRHAALEDVWSAPDAGFLPALRSGRPVEAASAHELVSALVALEGELSAATAIDRTLAHALHRIALESQVLLTDAWPVLGGNPAMLDLVRVVQEIVERVLSGRDVRYEGHAEAGAPGPEGDR